MIDVIVPVYRDLAASRRCLQSVLAAPVSVAFELVVVDDCSPEPALSAWLDELAAAGRITLLRNARNLGFVATVNRALGLHCERDVVLLNSDTEVAGDWLGRLLRCAHHHPDAASITPFSNNATLCSYPSDAWQGELPGSLGLAALDQLFADTLPAVSAELPTGVGFCRFMRRRCLDAIGAFDQAAFGRGYGEENDWCRRAVKAGWRNLLAADVFVYHQGGVSFGTERPALMAAGAAALRARHPEYDQLVGEFFAADPLQPLRQAIDEARSRCSADEAEAVRAEAEVLAAGKFWPQPPPSPAPPRWSFMGMEAAPVPSSAGEQAGLPVVLHLLHGWGAGAERWVNDLASSDPHWRHLCLRSRSGRNHAGVRLELLEPAVSAQVLLAWDLDQPIPFCERHHAQWRQVFDDIVAGCEVRALIVSSLAGHALDLFDSGLPVLLVLHDLFPFCPALFGWYGEVCGSCERERLQDCLRDNPFNVFWHQADAAAWLALRSAFAAALEGGRTTVVAPSASVRDRYQQLLPVLASLPGQIIPHGLRWRPSPLVPRVTPASGDWQERRLRILIPGRLAPHKGLALLDALLPQLEAFADVLLLGCGEYGQNFAQLPHVRQLADYHPAQLAAHAAVFAPDLALLPAVIPESFSYTLSEMQALAVPVLASELGAFTERIEHEVDGWLVQPEAAAMLSCLRALAAAPARIAACAQVLRRRPVRTAAQMAADYHRLLPGSESGLAPAASDRTVPGQASALLSPALDALQDARQWLDYRRREVARIHQGWQASEQALNARLATLTLQLQRAETELAALQASSSWRLTAPLRALRRLFRRAPVLTQHEQPALAAAVTVPQAVKAGEGERERLRAGLREALGLPDQAKIVLGLADGFDGGSEADEAADLLAFVGTAARVLPLRNELFFLWLSASEPAAAPSAAQLGLLLQASHRLHVRRQAEFARWMAGADVWLRNRPTAPVGEAGLALPSVYLPPSADPAALLAVLALDSAAVAPTDLD